MDNAVIPVKQHEVYALKHQDVNTATQVVGMPNAQELMVYQTWAKNAVDSQMYRGVGKESAVMMIMLAAREYGIGPAQALNGGLHIIEGKVELSARVMSALIRRAKHTLQIIESTDQICKIKGTRADTGETHTVTFTIEMAQKAGLIKEKGGWKRTPEDMLYARCVSRLARQLFSDVIGIGYIEGEIGDSRASNEAPEYQPEKYSEVYEEALPQMIADLLKHFDPADHSHIMTFIDEINAHYKESKIDTLLKLLNDIKVTSDQFNKWKNKRKLNEKIIDITSVPVTPSE
jgi:hypothetical protein